MQFLRQSTAGQVIRIGPLAKASDGTAQTGLTIANTDIRLQKNNATAFANKNSGGATELESGQYYCTLDATDSNTLGRLDVKVAMASTLVWAASFMVLPTQVYDSVVLGSDLLQVDSRELNGSAAAAGNLQWAAEGMVQFTVDTTGFTPTQTAFETNLTEATSNHYKDRVVEFRTGALAGQIAQITANTLQSGRVRLTVTSMTEAPANGDTGVFL